MTRKWVNEQKQFYRGNIQKWKEFTTTKLTNNEFLNESDKTIVEKLIDETVEKLLESDRWFDDFAFKLKLLRLFKENHPEWDNVDYENVNKFILDMWLNANMLCDATYFITHADERYIDSKPMSFDGDIIITDPCYIIRSDARLDWEESQYGSEMENLGFTTYMTRDTIYGDWGCTVKDTKTHKVLGYFCADAGLVSVFLLDEVLKYNPRYDVSKSRHSATIIKDFKGKIKFTITKSKVYDDYNVHVVGHGINKVTGEPINFSSRQTSC